MGPTRRRWIPAWARIWPPLILAEFVLNSTLTTTGDPRWSLQLHAYFPDNLGAFLAWTLPALGIVWSLARLWALPKGEPIGRRRAFWTMVRTGIGMTFVLIVVGAYVHAFNVSDVGSLNEFATWCALGLLMVLALFAIRSTRRFGFTPPQRIGGAIGTTAVLLVGALAWWGNTPADEVRGLHGAARASALVARLDDGPDEFERARRQKERTEGLGYSVKSSGDRVDLEVVVPWPSPDPNTAARILEFWNRPGREILGIPRPPWQAEWRASTSATEPPALVFAIRQLADHWTMLVLLRAQSEAAGIAQAPWDELRRVTSVLLDENYLPPATAPVPEDTPEYLQVTLLRLAMQADRYALACATPPARLLDGGVASDEFRAVAARARDLRATVLTPATPPPGADLVRFGERVTNLAVNNQWLRRPDGCDAIDGAEEARLSNIGDSIRKAGMPRVSKS